MYVERFIRHHGLPTTVCVASLRFFPISVGQDELQFLESWAEGSECSFHTRRVAGWMESGVQADAVPYSGDREL